jgi:hypothetical protein
MSGSAFFEHLRQACLLPEPVVAAAVARFPVPAPARTIARALVAEGLLTRFQARKLLVGKPRALRLGRYRLLARLGRGLTGPVFQAVHGTMERVVAIKVVRPQVLENRLALDLFRREVRAAAQLHHPGIVTAYDAGAARGRHFLVMEYVDGPSLQQLVQARGPLPVGLACDLMRQAAEALQYAHEKGMVHRDIKPANLLVASLSSPTPLVKVIDFGLARLHRLGTASPEGTIKVEPGTVLGTLDYIAPEQAENIHAADIRSDLYSLGCSFYYTLTGQVPFPGGNPLQKLMRHLTGEVPPVERLRPEVPAAVAAVVRRLMAKDPGQRFQTPAEVAEELARVCPAAPAAPGIRREAPALEPRTEGRQEVGGGSAVAGRPAEAQDTVEQLNSSAAPTQLVDGAFLDHWRRWIAVVEAFAVGQGHLYRARPREFHQLHQRLLDGCDARAAAAEAGKREFFQRLAGLVKPWVNPDALARPDREVLYSLVILCYEAEQKLAAELADTPAAREEGQTFVGSLLALFKWRRE